MVHYITWSPDWLLLLYTCCLSCDWLQERRYAWCARDHLMITSWLWEGSVEELDTCNRLSRKAFKPLRIHSFTNTRTTPTVTFFNLLQSNISDDLCFAHHCLCQCKPCLYYWEVLYSSLPLLVRYHMQKVLINCSPAVMGGCAGLERSAFILTTSLPRPVTLGGCAGSWEEFSNREGGNLVWLPSTSPSSPWFIGSGSLLLVASSSFSPALLNYLPLNLCCLCFCGPSWGGWVTRELSLLPELLHC